MAKLVAQNIFIQLKGRINFRQVKAEQVKKSSECIQSQDCYDLRVGQACRTTVQRY